MVHGIDQWYTGMISGARGRSVVHEDDQWCTGMISGARG